MISEQGGGIKLLRLVCSYQLDQLAPAGHILRGQVEHISTPFAVNLLQQTTQLRLT